MREEIIELQKLGRLPDSSVCVEEIDKYGDLIEKIVPPITDEEAKALVHLFGPDDCYGLAWSLLHLIETAPEWPLWECFQNNGNQWIRTLKKRAENSQIEPINRQ